MSSVSKMIYVVWLFEVTILQFSIYVMTTTTATATTHIPTIIDSSRIIYLFSVWRIQITYS